MKSLIFITLILGLFSGFGFASDDVFNQVEHHYAVNDGVRIHYVTKGEGPVLIMLHGFPDFWYTWRYQIADLSKDYKVVALDLRGYNKSDKPQGVESYAMRLLMKDVIAVIDDLKLEKATIVANDWGGAIAWQLAIFYPKRVEKLIACNIPHPAGIGRYLRENPDTGQYAQDFKQEGAENTLTPESLTALHTGLSETDRKRYMDAFKSSSFEGMLNYYRANYPSAASGGTASAPTPRPTGTKIKSPVLIIYGTQDTALPPGMLNNTWDWVDNEVTIYTIPTAGHFIQQEASGKVNNMIRMWLLNN